MNTGQRIFSQIMDFVPMYELRKCVQRYHGNYKVRNFSCWSQFLCLAFAQLTYRESLRDIVCCLRSMEKKLYHMVFRGNISRSTLADANETRDWRIYADFAQVLIHIARGCCKNANPDRHLCVCACRYHQEAVEFGSQSLHNFANSECDSL